MALDVALEIDQLGIETAIPEDFGCYSACAFMFLAGKNRYADGELGVHQISSENADLYDGQLTLADIIDVLNKFDTPPELFVPMLSTPPEEMYILSDAEISDFGFLKWSCFSGQVYGSAKMHLVYVHAAFRVSACWKYAASGVRLSRAV